MTSCSRPDIQDDARGPLVWALPSHRSGESQQIIGLAEALRDRLGAEMRVLRPGWTRRANIVGLLRRSGLAGLDAPTREALGARSPDVLVTAGLRNEPVARWLRRRSRGRTVTVLVGRTWAPPDAFSLVVTTPQYRLPDHPRVLQNVGTLHRLTAERLEEARTRFAPEFGALPSPRLGVLVGGDSGPFHIGFENARRIAERACALAGTGSLMVTTSSRTPRVATDTLQACLRQSDAQTRFWRWDPEGENPYFGILAWADALLVTGDSIAMTSEAVATGKPVRIFDLGGMAHDESGVRDETLRTRAYRWLMRYGHPRLTRDLRPAHEALIARGHAAWDDVALDDEAPGKPETPDASDLETTVMRIRLLLERRTA